MSVNPYQIHVLDGELELLKQKLVLARLDPRMETEQWAEDNGVTYQFMKDTLDFWRTKYDWRQEEARLNKLPQFTTSVEVEGYGPVDAHFVHATASSSDAVPLLFVHGWPGSFAEVEKILPALTAAGFHVVAPSLPNFGFSGSTDKAGFDLGRYAGFLHEVMVKLGYDRYFVQGGDWGALMVHEVALRYPKSVIAMHVNLLLIGKPDAAPADASFTPEEQQGLARLQWFVETNSAYHKLQNSKPRILGFGLHDSPVAMLAWMADKLFVWTDKYPWTPTELITWTLLHYFPGPTTALHPYRCIDPSKAGEYLRTSKVEVPSGISHFPKELGAVPRSWAECVMNIKFWRYHDRGGHFAAYERPDEMSKDLIEFFRSV